MKIRELLKKEIEKLNINKIEDSYFKAKILLAFEMACNMQFLNIHMEDEIEENITRRFENDIQKVIQGVPVQYITNHQEFYGLDFLVDENVLIPQPDTEILVEEVISLSKKFAIKPKIMDMCTGSGAIAIAIARNIESELVATDISKKALEIAKKNALKNNVQLELIMSDMFENINEKFDIIVSNPPYIETSVIETLSKEVRNEPPIALDGGEDGLKFYRILAQNASNYLNSNGFLAVEIGYNQGEIVSKLFEKYGFKKVYVKKDFAGNDRIVVGKVG